MIESVKTKRHPTDATRPLVTWWNHNLQAATVSGENFHFFEKPFGQVLLYKYMPFVSICFVHFYLGCRWLVCYLFQAQQLKDIFQEMLGEFNRTRRRGLAYAMGGSDMWWVMTHSQLGVLQLLYQVDKLTAHWSPRMDRADMKYVSVQDSCPPEIIFCPRAPPGFGWCHGIARTAELLGVDGYLNRWCLDRSELKKGWTKLRKFVQFGELRIECGWIWNLIEVKKIWPCKATFAAFTVFICKPSPKYRAVPILFCLVVSRFCVVLRAYFQPHGAMLIPSKPGRYQKSQADCFSE